MSGGVTRDVADTTAFRSTSVALGLALLLLAPGCLTSLEGGPPEDPTSFDYIYRADHDQEAPHPFTYEGAVASATLEGPSTAVEITGDATVTSGQDPPSPPEDAPGPSPPELLRRITLADVEGTVHYEDGSTRSLDGETVQLSTNSSFTLPNVTTVTTERLTVDGRQAEAWGLTPPVPTDASGTAPTRLATDGGRLGSTVDVAVSSDGAPAGHEGQPGVLELAPGTYAFSHGPIAAEIAGPVSIDGEHASVTIVDPAAPVTLRGDDRAPGTVTLTARSVTGSYEPGSAELTLDGGAVQWFEDDRPQFEAGLDARFHDHGREASITLERGENETLWLAGTETSNVGTAERVHVQVETNVTDVGLGTTWYDTPDPHVLERLASGLIEVFFGLFVDRTVTTFAPGETLYMPVIVEVPEDAPAGTYETVVELAGDNARSDPARLSVTVPS